jgi:hypothetical protein
LKKREERVVVKAMTELTDFNRQQPQLEGYPPPTGLLQNSI